MVDFVLEGVVREVWGLVSLAHLSRKLLVEDKRTDMEASEVGSSQEDLNLVRFDQYKNHRMLFHPHSSGF